MKGKAPGIEATIRLRVVPGDPESGKPPRIFLVIDGERPPKEGKP